MAGEMFSLDGRVALVTGSTRGIGAAIARGFAAAGARVYVHGRRREQGERVAREIGGVFVPADLSDPGELAALAARVLDAEERLDVLVNNAGVEVPATIDELNPELAQLIMQINYLAPVELTRRLLPLLRASRGASVINVSSIHSWVAYKGNAAYCAAKAALDMFTRTLAVELGPEGIRVNSLAPGAVETDINRDLLDEIGREKFRAWIPLGRVADEREMVGPALFLASPASSYVTGSLLVADGAYSHHLVRYAVDGVAHDDAPKPPPATASTN